MFVGTVAARRRSSVVSLQQTSLPVFLPSGPDGLLGFGQCGVDAKELLDAGDFQGIENTFIYADEGEGAPVFAVIDISADKGTDASRVDVGDRGEVDDEGTGLLGAEGRLELEKGSEYNGALQAKNALSGKRAFDFLDGERLLR